MKRHTKKSKREVGRPSKYWPYYCGKLVEYLRQGHTVVSFCNEYNIRHRTFYYWVRKHPEFATAFDIAQTGCVAYYERIGRLATIGKLKINTRLWIRRMKQLRRWQYDSKYGP